MVDQGIAPHLYGPANEHLRIIERAFGVRIGARGNTVTLHGEGKGVAAARSLLDELCGLLEEGYPVASPDVEQAVQIVASGGGGRLGEIFGDTIVVSSRQKRITPRSAGQKIYADAIRRHDLVFGVGPAGTGKTYLAMAMAMHALLKHEVSRILLTRPAVEAGERLGFLPGDLAEKVNPYLRPLYDALHDMMDFDRAQKLMERGTIEVAPLAFMRGRTLNDAFVILDEAQNSTPEQMKMFLTRLGFGSKAVVTGDVTQIDLPERHPSGMIEALEILQGVAGIAIVHLGEADVVRHRLVKDIIRAYDRYRPPPPRVGPSR